MSVVFGRDENEHMTPRWQVILESGGVIVDVTD